MKSEGWRDIMLENIQLSFQGIFSHKLRSLLTMLGIIIGIASIITIVSTIKGTNEQIKENLVGSGNNVVNVRLMQDGNEIDLQYQGVPDGVSVITEETRRELVRKSGIRNVSLYRMRSYADSIYYKDTAFNGNVYGIDSRFFPINQYKLLFGRNFSDTDRKKMRSVVIVDSATAKSLFGGSNPLGKTIEISSYPFTVIGVVEKKVTQEPKINNVNDYYTYKGSEGSAIFIPDSAWPIAYRYDEPQYAAVQADSTEDMTKAGSTAAKFLTRTQIQNAGGETAEETTTPEAAADGAVEGGGVTDMGGMETEEGGNDSGSSGKIEYKADDLLKQATQLQQLSNSTNRQLIWIAGISLLVGGIGVMNIMLVSVTERTREIGLKKALGAKRRRIAAQFLTEAAVLTSMGGILGVISGIILSKILARVLGMPSAISPLASIISVVFSMAIGIIFGFLPAVKAAKLNPIDALRYE